MRFRPTLICGLLLTSVTCLAGARAQDTSVQTIPGVAPHVLIVGGGPDLAHNQVAIESNVRYVSRVIAPGAPRRILFADGKTDTSDVLYLDSQGKSQYRVPNLPALDGPSRLDAFHDALTDVAKKTRGDGKSAPPLLLYFTGHGSPGRNNLDNNRYDLWKSEELSVQHLATEIAALPRDEPVTVVMVECFSGAFGNLLFEGGAPDGNLIDRPICGFFASIAPRMAAGCTPEVNEDDYRDFTSYFFAALSGEDRKGRPITGADYNHDGVVGMDEAFAYTLIHDVSIDTPVCTSDVFLRRYIKTPDADLFHSSYSEVLSWATPAQAAALEGLSEKLKYTTDDRLTKAYEYFRTINVNSEAPRDVNGLRFVRVAKSVMLAHALTTGNDKKLKERYAALVRAESANPLLRKALPDAAKPTAATVRAE